eukprot:3733-Heterococcus_DN1.PRE.3
MRDALERVKLVMQVTCTLSCATRLNGVTNHWCRHLCTSAAYALCSSTYRCAPPTGAAVCACSQPLCSKDGKKLNMQAAVDALEAVGSDAEEELVAVLKDAVAKATVKYNKALKGEGTAKSMGWVNNGRRNVVLLTLLVTLLIVTDVVHVEYLCAHFSHILQCTLLTAKEALKIKELDAKVDAAAKRVFVAAQVFSGVYVDGWEHLSKVTRDVASSQVHALLQWDTELQQKVLVYMQQSSDIRAVDSILSIKLQKDVTVTECATISAYLQAVGITV